MRRIAPILFIFIGLMAPLAVGGSQTFAQSEEEKAPLKVVTKEIEPFVFLDEEEVSGFSIELWEAVAQEIMASPFLKAVPCARL